MIAISSVHPTLHQVSIDVNLENLRTEDGQIHMCMCVREPSTTITKDHSSPPSLLLK